MTVPEPLASALATIPADPRFELVDGWTDRGGGVWSFRFRAALSVPASEHIDEWSGWHLVASSWAERRGIPQVTFSLDMRLGARAGFKRNERMLSLDPRYVIAFPGNGVLERLVIEAKAPWSRHVRR